VCTIRDQAYLFDKEFYEGVDGVEAHRYVMFKCGRALRISDHAVVLGEPSMLITKHTGYNYPSAEFAKIDAELAPTGLDLHEMFTAVKSLEAMQSDLPATLIDKFAKLAKLPSMEILGFSYECFAEPRGGGWLVVIFRVVKFIAAALFAVRVESFCNDLGESGNNGKTWLQQVLAGLLGSYYFELKETQLTADPPGPEAPAATLLSMRGARGMGTPEVEAELCIKGSWCKKLADSSSKWKARAPHSTMEFEFRLFSIFFVSTNSKVKFSKIDGGVARRANCVLWPWEFTSRVVRPNEQKLASTLDIKEMSWIGPRLAGLLYVLLKFHKA